VSAGPLVELRIERGGERLDRLLAAHVPDLSRRGARRLIEAGAVFLDGKRCLIASRIVQAGARVVVHPEPRAPVSELPILYEDDRVIAVDKPAGVHVNETETTARISMAHALDAYVVHRLDGDTTGVLLLAKDPATAAELSRCFRERAVEKRYIAVVRGRVSDRTIDLPIGHDPKRPRARAVRPDGRPATTRVRAISEAGELSTVAVEILTGRTHQIRVHLAHAGAPIFGDLTYGGHETARIGAAVVTAARPLLHAFRLNVPLLGRVLSLEAPLPPDMRALEGHGLAFSLPNE
jgi:23S rRNA pseudouridine1911/1915/1917 synthase